MIIDLQWYTESNPGEFGEIKRLCACGFLLVVGSFLKACTSLKKNYWMFTDLTSVNQHAVYK